MIDIHCHILPMVDDGSSSVDMSLEMLDAAYRHGTTSVILTPHLAYAYGFENPTDKIVELYHQFKQIVRQVGIPIQLHLGCEYLFTTRESFYRHEQDITLMNHTNYLLMEFYFDIDEEDMLDAIDCVQEAGFHVIIAHPERFEAIQINTDLARKIQEKGALLQMNKGSILGKHGRKAYETVIELLEEERITFVGSDAHHPIYRDSKMDEAYEVCCEMFDEEYIYSIFNVNPTKYLNIREEYEDEEEY